ncbi:Putative zinc protease [Photobacterium marinum]|uniref:Putative zinc protease n=1 Tax=Photobacterium marinum TaxID=1056511 RepID=L8JFF1_9GAMM|nr:insulinase family protein [Photobacterium marinum]ELR66229.1 Putative zinc protease [Photobacterium marinum]
MLKKLLCLVLSFSLLSCASVSTQYAQLPYNKLVEKGQLENGFKYFLAPNSKPSDRVYIRLVVNAGSMNEDDDQSGVAHIVEHMAFNGTENYPGNSLIDELEKMGMKFGVDINAFTDFENTVYILNLPNNEPDLINLALEIVADWTGRVTFHKADLEAERGVVLEEWRSRLGPQLRLGDKKSAVEMAGSRYVTRDPIGSVYSIKNVSVERVADFYYRWYRADNMSLVIAGDVDASRIKQQISEKFAYLNQPEKPMDPIDYSVPIPDQLRVASVTEASRADSSFEFSFLKPYQEDNSFSAYKQSFIKNIATKLVNIRFQEWQEKQTGLINSATYFSTSLGRETSQDLFSLQLSEPKFEQAAEQLFAVLAQIKQHGFLASEFEGERERIDAILTRRAKSMESPYSIDLASDMVDSAATGQLIMNDEVLLKINQSLLKDVTLEQVNAAFTELIKPQARMLMLTHPNGVIKPTLTTETAEQLWQAAMNKPQPKYQVETVTAELPEPPSKAGDLTLEKEWLELGIKEYRLSNGSKLIYNYSDTTPNEVHFKMYTAGGLMSVPAEDYSKVKIAAEVIDEYGMGSLSRKELRTIMNGRPIAFTTILDDYEQGFSGWSRSNDIDTLFKLSRLKHEDVVVTDEIVAEYKRDMIRRLSEATRDAEDVFARKVSAVRFPQQPTVYSLTMQAVDSVDTQSLIDAYRQYVLSKTDYTYYIVGDIKESILLPKVKRYLASLPVKKQQRQMRQFEVASPDERLVVKQNREPSSEVEIYLSWKTPWSLQKNYQLDVAGELVQQELRQVLREEASGVYGVSSWFWQEPNDGYAIGRISFNCAPERVDELINLTDKVLAKVKENGVSEQGLDNIKNQRKDRYQRLVKSNLGWLDVISQSYARYGVPTEIYAQEKLNEQLDKSVVDKTLLDMLNHSERFEAVLMPEDDV